MDSSDEFDVLIFGGGPAGVSAGMWADELGLSSAIVDRGSRLGGQLLKVYNPIRNFPGVEFSNGTAMSEKLQAQMSGRSTRLFLDNEVVAVEIGKGKLIFADGNAVKGRSLILATGVRRRRLNVPGETEFYGKGIMSSGAQEPTAATGKVVAVIGGGDAALENALILSEHAKKVILIHRRAKFAAREEFVAKVSAEKKIELVLNSNVTGFFGHSSLGSIKVVNDVTKRAETLAVDAALIRVGFQPNSELFSDQVECDAHGFVATDSKCRTSSSGCFAVGDLCRPHRQTVCNAFGDGATAVNSTFETRSR